jgi:hypothetical protein
MNVDRLVLSLAGIFILTSLALSQLYSPYWLLFTAFVGANLFQASFTGFCPLAKILRALGVQAGVVFKVNNPRPKTYRMGLYTRRYRADGLAQKPK